MDYKKYEEEPVEEGEEPEEDTRDIFYTDLYVYLGKQYAEYVDWMAKTSVVPLWGKLEEVWPEGYVPPVPTPSLLQLRPDSSTERLMYSSISLGQQCHLVIVIVVFIVAASVRFLHRTIDVVPFDLCSNQHHSISVVISVIYFIVTMASLLQLRPDSPPNDQRSPIKFPQSSASFHFRIHK